MILLMTYVVKQYGQQPIYWSVYPDDDKAIGLYEQLGFSFTGELDENEEQLMKTN